MLPPAVFNPIFVLTRRRAMKKASTPRELLAKVDIFKSLDTDSLSLIVQKMKLVQYQKGDIICREGETGDRMYVIVSGEVDVLKKGTDDAEISITVLHPGEVAGVMSIFDKDVRSATLRAARTARLLVLDKDTFQHILSRNTELANKLLAFLSRQLRAETQTVANLLSGDVDKRLKVAFFDTKPYTKSPFTSLNKERYALYFFEARLNLETASLTSGFQVVCAFVNDDLSARVLEQLKRNGVEMIAMRCAGYNNVDIEAAHRLGISIIRVPAYSPNAVAEHAIALTLALNRKIYRAYNRVREGNFSLNGLLGFDLYKKTAGVIGVGKIGKCLVQILRGFGMRVLGYDAYKDEEFARQYSLEYEPLDSLFTQSDVISLHAPLLPETFHIINRDAIKKMKPGVILVNTSRGALIDTSALINGLKSGKIGAAGLDVYEEEEQYFFEDLSDKIITDDTLARLMTFNNVIITSHQAFFTREALSEIARVTLEGISRYEQGKRMADLPNAVLPKNAR
jgi:D-lactate dehydrogenase